MKKINANFIRENWKDLTEFEYDLECYYRSTKLKTFFNSVLGSNIKAAFISTKDIELHDVNLGWDGQFIILVNHKDELVLLTNSEWATFRIIK